MGLNVPEKIPICLLIILTNCSAKIIQKTDAMLASVSI
jgi:hypothetical protein